MNTEKLERHLHLAAREAVRLKLYGLGEVLCRELRDLKTGWSVPEALDEVAPPTYGGDDADADDPEPLFPDGIDD